jgi:Double zinc ribbon
MQCPRCHAENREGRRFCGECGLSFALMCPSCGFVNEGSEKFCGGCGAPIEAKSSPPGYRFQSPELYMPKQLAERIPISKSARQGERKQDRAPIAPRTRRTRNSFSRVTHPT